MLRRTRIVATLGPSTDHPGVLDAMVGAGLDVARINFSHGDREEHLRRVLAFRQAGAKAGRNVAVLADLPGPKLRVRIEKPLELNLGDEISVASREGAEADITVTEPQVIADVQSGQRILLDDGRLALTAVRAEPERIVAIVDVGGTLLPNKGLNLPETRLSIPHLTDRDREAIALATEARADWLAVSFVRSPDAANETRQAARELGLKVPILAKMERPEAVDQAQEIIDAFDGIMVARGDLGVEIPLERVPLVQKRLISLARASGKPVITATDMLDSMRHSPRPTRAEASDVANAIYDGSDAVMLSGETAVGDYPMATLACMDRIIREAEVQLATEAERTIFVPRGKIEDYMTHTVCALARDLKADAILAPTFSGKTPRLIARHRPKARILAVATDVAIIRQLALVWGLVPVPLVPGPQPGEDRLHAAMRAAFQQGAVRSGELVVALAAHPIEGAPAMQTIRVIRVG